MGLILALLSCPLCAPSFAFSSHFDSDGAPLSDLSWPSSLAVVAVSFSGLITFIFLMLACLCCKKGDIGFKIDNLELDNVEGEDYTTEFSIQSSPAVQNGPEVYVLPLTEVSVPMSKQPARSVQFLKSPDLGRQSLLYLKEIGGGWFGKVLHGEVNSGLSSSQVVVKELKVSASVQEQILFLEETQPFRVLQHPNLLQCLAQWAEVTPYLLVMEFCPLGDVKGYLQSCAASESTSPDPLTLQRMGCEVCCGLLHLHKNNYTHSDLALRNCLLSADLTVKIGDYGLSHSKYRDDYLVTSDQLWLPLRWIAPELIDEVHGNLLVVDQTRASNIWSLGITLWELFELGRQPYDTYSDPQVLSYVIKEQQLKLPKPQLKQLLSDRWYEVMQFCWLQPEQRPSAEEVHLLLSYLSVKGAGELEEEFEKRWNAMKPNGGADSGGHHDAELSSYPLLEHFSSDGFHSDGDDVLTVTQTSQGLNFEYKWERGRHEQYPLSPGCQPYQDMYYTTSTGDRLSLGVSPSGYANKDCNPDSRPLELVPVLSARSPSVAGDYYIRIEEHLGSNVQQECSLQHEEHSLKEEPGIEEEPCDDSPISLSMEPLLVQVVSSSDDTCWLSQAQSLHSSSPSGDETDGHLVQEHDSLKGYVDPLEAPPFFLQLCQAQSGAEEMAQPDGSESEVTGQMCGERHDSVTIEAEDGSEHHDTSEKTSQLPTFSPHWASNISSNNNISSDPQQHSPGVWCNHRSEDTQENEALPPYGPETWQAMETGEGDNASIAEGLREDFYKAEEHVTQDRLETLVPPGPFSPPAPENTETSAAPSDHVPHPLESPDSPDVDSSQDKDSGQDMDPLGVGLASHCELSEPSCNLPTTEQDNTSNAVSPGVSISPDREISSLEKPIPTDFFQLQSESEDEDTMELTSGVYTDLSSERGDTAPSFRSLQKQVGTPDSLDSLDMPSTASSCEAFGLATYTPCAQPKALDSGYDTENYESPEFVLKEPQENRETEVYYQLSQSQEQSLEPGDMPMSRSVSSDLQGLDAKNPYRDSAYFSDYDSFNREEEEEGDQRDEREQQEASESLLCPELDIETTIAEDLRADSGQCAPKVEGDLPEITLSPLPSTASKEVSFLEPHLIVREESVDEGLGLESQKDSSTEKPNGTLLEEPAQVHRTFTLSPVQLCLTKTCMVKPGAAGSITLTTGLQADDKSSGKREALGASHLSKCLSPPLIRKEGRVGDSADDDDEDEESDDSDESDEELRCYNIQEHSEESEEEHITIPIVITDHGSCGHLRSLLKTPSFLPPAEPTDLDRKKKAVSFFDDVTVYLFDQESPTLEVPDQELPELPSVLQMTFKEPTNHLLGGGGEFEWDESLSGKPVKSSFVTSLPPVVLITDVDSAPDPVPVPVSAPVPVPVPVQKPQLPVQFSRFSVSPTAVSRFSITQVADNAVGSLEERVKSGDQV